jgi:hypothetical protein
MPADAFKGEVEPVGDVPAEPRAPLMVCSPSTRFAGKRRNPPMVYAIAMNASFSASENCPTMGFGVLYPVSVAMTESLDIPGDLSQEQLFARGVLQLGYRYRSSTRMVAPKVSNACSKSAKWCPHHSSEPPGNFAVLTTARAGQRSHRSAAVRVRAGFLPSEVFISAIPPHPHGELNDAACVTVHRDQRPTSDWSLSPTEARPRFRPWLAMRG